MSVQASIRFEQGQLFCEGDWRLPAVGRVEEKLDRLPISANSELLIDTRSVEALDLAGARLLQRVVERAEQAGLSVSYELEDRHQRLLELVATVPTLDGAALEYENLLSRIGRHSRDHWIELKGFLAFVGETWMELVPRLIRPWRFRGRRLVSELEQAGVNAVPIVSLLSFLVGIVIAYQLSSGLEGYGATLFLPELLSTTILRELGPLIVAIVVAGRTASAYAAQLGTMKINEEIDALRTLGISPFDMLVLPKFLALLLALPLLTVLASLTGILGGVVVNWASHDLSLMDFMRRLPEGMGHRHLWLGLAKAPVFAAVIAIIGCRQGMRVTRGAEGVGHATTTAVVQAIFSVIVINAIFSIFYNVMGL